MFTIMTVNITSWAADSSDIHCYPLRFICGSAKVKVVNSKLWSIASIPGAIKTESTVC